MSAPEPLPSNEPWYEVRMRNDAHIIENLKTALQAERRKVEELQRILYHMISRQDQDILAFVLGLKPAPAQEGKEI